MAKKLGKNALANLTLDTSCQIDLGSEITAIDSSNYSNSIEWGFNHDNPIQNDTTFRQQKSYVLDAIEADENTSNGKFYFDYRKITDGNLILQKRYNGNNMQNIVAVGDTSATWVDTKTDRENVKYIYIPYGVINLTNYCFAGTGIESVDIPDSVTILGINCFMLSKLKEFTASANIKSIGGGAFSQSELRVADLSNSIVTTLAGVFQSCSNLSRVDLPESLQTISTNNFRGCTSLTSITIPANVTSIDSTAFIGCTNLATITIDNTEGSIAGADVNWGCPNPDVTIIYKK